MMHFKIIKSILLLKQILHDTWSGPVLFSCLEPVNFPASLTGDMKQLSVLLT